MSRGKVFEARHCPAMPVDCVDYGVISHATGKEVCRVWKEDDARLIADLLNATLSPPAEGAWQDVVGRLRELLARATPGPWEIGHPMERNYIYGGDAHLGCIGSREEQYYLNDDDSPNESDYNAALIVAAVNALPDLLATIESLHARLGEATNLLDDLEHSEAEYRLMHDRHGDGAMAAGRAWDRMRRDGDKARSFLAGGGEGEL